jgi:hypothetical protein
MDNMSDMNKTRSKKKIGRVFSGKSAP